MKAVFYDIRLISLCLALGLYAVFGSPTPDEISWVEISLAGLMAIVIGLNGFVRSLVWQGNEKQNLWWLSGALLWVYGLTGPMIIAVVQGNAISIILRDFVAFFFLCLPLFLCPFLKSRKRNKTVFFFSLLTIGLIFSLRVVAPHWEITHQDVKLLYLANSPLVLMALIFFSLKACRNLYDKIDYKHLLHFFLFTAGASLILMAVYIDVQRAFLVTLIISALSVLLIGIVKAPLKTILPLCLVALTIFIFKDFLIETGEQALLKTSQVGSNMRLQELQAVWQVAKESPFTLLFGHGWGSVFPSPAVDNIYVAFTHSLLSYMLLKTGLIGLLLTLIYLFFIFEKLVSVYFSDPVKGNMLLWPFVIPILFYASYKSFDFGLLLTVIVLFSVKERHPKT